MSDWKDCNEIMPIDGSVIDVWQSYYDDDTGKKKGHRLTNCWVHNGEVLHGKNAMPIKYFTHWMPLPKPPID